jgi:hypothetical protein
VRRGRQWVRGTDGPVGVLVRSVGLRIRVELRGRVEWIGVRRIELGIVGWRLVERLELGRVLRRIELGIVGRRLVERLELWFLLRIVLGVERGRGERRGASAALVQLRGGSVELRRLAARLHDRLRIQ